MKFLYYELYEKACKFDDELFEKEWNEQYKKYVVEFAKLSHRLPKRFCSEYTKNFFHDNIISSFYMYIEKLKTQNKFNIIMEVQDYQNNNISHIITFIDVKKIRSNIVINSHSGYFDWIYSEILPVDDSYMSFEVLLYDDSFLSFEFTRLKYQKSVS